MARRLLTSIAINGAVSMRSTFAQCVRSSKLKVSHLFVPFRLPAGPDAFERRKHALPDSCSPFRASRKSKRLFPQATEEISDQRPISDPERAVMYVKVLGDKVGNKYGTVQN
jgi:hypothetical protein